MRSRYATAVTHSNDVFCYSKSVVSESFALSQKSALVEGVPNVPV